MQKITTFLTYENQAEEAVKLYVSVFKNARILNESRYPEGTPMPAGSLMSATFEIEGQQFMALNGGPHFKFADGISLFVDCKTQAEVDELWEKLSEGGEKQPCGWLKDKFGVSWQIIPSVLGELLGNPDPVKAQRVMQAMLQMTKIDIQKLEAARDGT